jgi:hypothetical protein
MTRKKWSGSLWKTNILLGDNIMMYSSSLFKSSRLLIDELVGKDFRLHHHFHHVYCFDNHGQV